MCDIISFDAITMADNDQTFLKFARNTVEQFGRNNPLLKDFKESIRIAHWYGSVYYFSFDPASPHHICGFAHIIRNKEDNSIDLLTLITKNKRTKKSRELTPLYKNAGTNIINRIINDYSGEYKYFYIDEIKKTAEPFYKKLGFIRIPPKPHKISFQKEFNKKKKSRKN